MWPVSCAFAAPASPLFVSRTGFTTCRRPLQPPTRVAVLRRRVHASAAQMAPEGQIAVLEIGYGTDLHGQDATAAAVRACKNAISFNSLPGITRLLPDGDLSRMTLHVKLGVPSAFGKDIDEERVRAQFPYGTVVVEVVDGGLCCHSGIVLPDKGDGQGDDRAIVVVAAVSAMC